MDDFDSDNPSTQMSYDDNVIHGSISGPSESIGDRVEGPPSSNSLASLAQSTVLPKPAKTGAAGVRQRLTVVCAECKRLKLRCDRRTPCQQCLKRECIDKCIYTQAATEKVDITNVNNRVTDIERMMKEIVDSHSIFKTTSRLSSVAGYHPLVEKPKALLAVGANGASVAVSLEGATSLWVDQLGLGGESVIGSSGDTTTNVSLPAVEKLSEDGITKFYEKAVRKFRFTGTDDLPVASDDDEDEDDEEEYSIGVSPQTVFELPDAATRAQIYTRYEAAHVMVPCANFFNTKKRIENMCRWAKKICGEKAADKVGFASDELDELLPAMSTPTLSFFAVATAALALGAQCWLAERDMGYGSDGNIEHSSLSSPTNGASQYSPSGIRPHREASVDDGSVFPIEDSLPISLFKLSKMALDLYKERAGYSALDLDYVHARTVQCRFLLLAHHGLGDSANLLSKLGSGRRKKGNKKVNSQSKGTLEKTRHGPSLTLAPELVGLVSEVVGNARMMGLGHDPDLVGGQRLTLFEKEMRRRLWWEVVSLDAFLADCLCHDPLLGDSPTKYSTNLPSDVDEELFQPDSAGLPPPNIESLHGNIEYFIQRNRLLQLMKTIRYRLNRFRESNPDAQSSDLLDQTKRAVDEVKRWIMELPDHFKLKNVLSGSDSSKRRFQGRAQNKSTFDEPKVQELDSPFIIAMRCDLAMAGRMAIAKLYLPFVKASDPTVTVGSEDDLEDNNFNFLHVIKPAMAIVRTWKYLHSIFRHVRPSMFICFAFTRVLFEATVILGYCAINEPVCSLGTVECIRNALDVLKDPSVLTGRPTAGESGNLPSEAVRIVEALLAKAEVSQSSLSGVTAGKRKHEDGDSLPSELFYNFRFPYTGAGIVNHAPQTAAASTIIPPFPFTPPDSAIDANSASSRVSGHSGSSGTRSVTVVANEVAMGDQPAKIIANRRESMTTEHDSMTVRERLCNSDSHSKNGSKGSGMSSRRARTHAAVAPAAPAASSSMTQVQAASGHSKPAPAPVPATAPPQASHSTMRQVPITVPQAQVSYQPSGDPTPAEFILPNNSASYPANFTNAMYADHLQYAQTYTQHGPVPVPSHSHSPSGFDPYTGGPLNRGFHSAYVPQELASYPMAPQQNNFENMNLEGANQHRYPRAVQIDPSAQQYHLHNSEPMDMQHSPNRRYTPWGENGYPKGHQ